MGEHKQSLLIDRDLRPGYYDEFHCLMSACRQNCCQGGWHIGFSKKDYQTLKAQKGSPDLNARLEHCVRHVRKGAFAGRDYGEFVLRDGECPLLRDGICALQKEKGEEVLPEVCRVFPRQEEYLLSGYLERTLTPACEGVLALLWELEEGVGFVSDPLPEAQWRRWVNPEGQVLPPWFQEIRSACIDLLQNRRLPLPERIFVMGMALKELAEGETDVPRWLKRAAALPEGLDPGFLPRDRTTLSLRLAHTANIFYALAHGGKPVLRELPEALGLERDSENGRVTIEGGSYLRARSRFEESLGKQDWFWENLMVTLFYNWRMPDCNSPQLLWRSYVNYCNLYSIYRFLSVMSCREGAEGGREELFRLLVIVSRALLHSAGALDLLCDQLYQSGSATLAHMAILLGGD